MQEASSPADVTIVALASANPPEAPSPTSSTNETSSAALPSVAPVGGLVEEPATPMTPRSPIMREQANTTNQVFDPAETAAGLREGLGGGP